MTIHFADKEEIASWDAQVLANPDGGNVLQSFEMAEQKSLGNWKPRYLRSESLAITVLERTVFGLGKLWYIIRGPGVTTTQELSTLLPDLEQMAKKNGVYLVKIEPEIIQTDEALAELSDRGLIRARNIQPNASTVFLDISSDLDTIMANFNQKTRHAIRRAERDGAVIKAVPATNENCREMYKLYKMTAEGKFGIRPYAYHKHFWQNFERAQMGQLFFAYAADGALVAAAYALIFGGKSTYKDGASLRERPVYGMSHLLQWRMIEWAKSKGAHIHDFCGSPPSDQIKNSDHPFYGFGRFKTSFNKDVVDFIGVYDVVIRPVQYRIWSKIGERLMLRWHRWRHRESYY